MVSVVVPVYNVEKYIRECVESLLRQTYTDYEIILVDDGSTDSSALICDEYAQKNDKITVLHKENGGLSDARNAGTQLAKGQYVTYVDSDDIVADEYLMTLWNLLTEHRVDIAIVGISTFEDGEVIKKTSSKVQTHLYTGVETFKNMLYQNTLDTSACAILLPIELSKAHPFPYKKYHEDELTTYKYYLSVNRVAVSTEALYYYRQREGSIMHVFGQASLDGLDAADNLVSVCEKGYPQLVKAANAKKFSDYCQVLLKIENIQQHVELYNRVVSYLKTQRHMVFDCNARIKNRVAAMILWFGPRALIFVNRFL